MKIDCHLHLPTFDGLESLEAKKNKLLIDLKTNNIDRAIVIPDHIKGSSIGDLDDCINLFKDQPNIYLMGTLNILKDDESIILKLDNLFQTNIIKAIKIFPGHDPHYPNDTRLNKVFDLCIKYDAPLVIHTGWNVGDSDVAKYNDPKYIVEVAKKYQNLKIVIAHYFWPQVDYCFEITKDYSNIYFDTSGLACSDVEEITGKEKIKNVLEKTIALNSNKVLYGTDYGMCDMKKHLELIESLDIDQEIKEDIYYKNVIKLFNL